MLLASVFALATSLFWAVGPIFFASAGQRVGSFPVNLLRIVIGSVLIGVLALTVRLCGLTPGSVPTWGQAGWFALSGLLGMAVGDLMNFESMVLVGPRMNVQINCSLVPVLTAGLAWRVGQGVPGWVGVVGFGLVLVATSSAVVVAGRVRKVDGKVDVADRHHLEPRVSGWGIGLTVAAACMTAGGMVAGRQATVIAAGTPGAHPDPLLAALIRLSTACVLLWAWPVYRGRVGKVVAVMKDRDVAANILVGTVIGPVGGVLCLMAALGMGDSGPVSAIVSTSPLWILPILRWRHGIRLGPVAWVAAAAAVVGVAMITLDPGMRH
jgi:drug/metabolite transporter (DMT)-like permease